MAIFVRLRDITSVGTLCLAVLAGTAKAQSYESGPIEFDIFEDTADGAAPLLIAAYQPPTDAVPSFAPGGTGRAAEVTAAGFPEPSIILGEIAPGQEAAFGIETLLPGTVAEMAFAYDDLETRVAMRDGDPEIFRMLVEQGHIDPPAEQLNAALQTELQRMNCYRSGIDGLWGRGSARSVGEYFGKRDDGATWPDQQPSNELFRAIIMYPDVRCETPQVQAPAPRTTRVAPAQPRATTQRRTTTQQPAARAPTQTAPTRRPTITTGGGIGVFR